MSNPITAQQIVDRIKQNLAVPWKTPGVDGFLAGSPETSVTGIATTFAASLDVLRRAIAGGKNMIVIREMPFWHRNPKAASLRANPTYIFKQEFVARNNLVIWRLRDNWDGRRGLVSALGWDKVRSSGNFFQLPPASLAGLAREHPEPAEDPRSARTTGPFRPRRQKPVNPWFSISYAHIPARSKWAKTVFPLASIHIGGCLTFVF